MGRDRLGPLASARVRLPVLALSGVLGALAYPGVDWSLLAWIWLVPTLVCALGRAPCGALADGWLAGTVFFLVLLRWLDHTFRHYSAIPWPLGWLPILALAAYCGLYVGAVAWAVSWLKGRIGTGVALALASAFWVAGEWLRGSLMGGFPWGLLGYSQHSALPVIQIAEVGGVYAVSLLVMAVSSAVAAFVALGWRRALPGAAAVTVLLFGALAFGWWALHPESGMALDAGAPRVPLAVIQPSIEQTLKWDPARHAEIMDVYERLTREAVRSNGRGSRPAAVLWPETAATIFLRGDPALLSRLTSLASELQTPILVGSLDRLPGPRGQFLNSAFLLTGQGISAKYDKIHLVPFGEFVPLAALIGFVRSWAEFISEFAAGETYTVFPLSGAPFGTVICYEIIFPELFRAFVARGAVLMINITNDAWFGGTSGPWQHLGMLPLRAVEHRVGIARAANTGVSAFVLPSGRMGPTLGLFERGTLRAEVPVRRRTTLYTRFGDWLAYACLGLAGASLAAAWFRRSPVTC